MKKPKISLIAAICMVIVCAIVAGCAAAGPANMATDPTGSTPAQSTDPTQPKELTKWVYLVTGRKVEDYTKAWSYDQEFRYDENWMLTGWVVKRENRDPYQQTIEVNAKTRTMKVYVDDCLTESYTYDVAGNLIHDVYYSDGKTTNERKYTYTADGRLLQILDYRYDDNGEAHDIVEELRTYDLYGRLDTKSVYSYLRELPSEEEKEGHRSYHYRYHYDDNGRLARMDTYEDGYASGTDIDEYTLYVYSETERSVTENTYATHGNSVSGYTQVLDAVRIVRYDEAGKVIYTEKYDVFDSERKTVTTYTYQAVQVPLDAFTPAYISLPEEHPNFLTGNGPEISQEDHNQYIQAVAALEQYAQGHDITYTDEYGTYNGQDALWAICRLLVRLEDHGDCAELLRKFRAVDVVNKSITVFDVPLSDIEQVITKNHSFTYNNQGQLVSMWCEGIFEDLELSEDTFVQCQYGDGKLVGFTAYDEEGGNLVARVQFHYDDQGRRTGGQIGLSMDQAFPISYFYDAAGRLSGWDYVNLQGSRTEMTYTYDEQGRLQQTVQNQFLSNGQDLQALSRKVTRDYSYDVAGSLAMIVETECQYREGQLITQQEDRIFLEYDSKGRLQEFQRMIQATKDQDGNILGDAKTKWETTLYFYESWLVYEP